MMLIPFLTAYDPNDAPGGSVDPLGFGQGYDALAEALLPGTTNVANRPRYLSVLCLGALLGEEVAPGDRVARTRGRRLDCILRLERFWALANILSWRDDAGTEEWWRYPSGIRGLTYVGRHAEHLEVQGADRCSARFPMLSRQARYGAVGIYGAVAERLGLWDRKSLALKPDSGRALAERFRAETKAPKALLDAVRGDGDVSLKTLRRWGDRAHVTAETRPGEARYLREAFLRDGTRARVAELLADHPPRDTESAEEPELDRLERLGQAARERDHARDIAALIEMILAFEDTYRWCLLGFERVLFACSQAPGGAVALGALAQDPVLPQIGAAMSEVRRRFERALDALHELELGRAVASRLPDVLTFVQRVSTCGSDVAALVRTLLTRHTDVQRGKFDHGQRKMPWVEDRGGGLALTQARWGIDRADLTRPDDITPHAYRTRSADALIHASHYHGGAADRSATPGGS